MDMPIQPPFQARAVPNHTTPSENQEDMAGVRQSTSNLHNSSRYMMINNNQNNEGVMATDQRSPRGDNSNGDINSLSPNRYLPKKKVKKRNHARNKTQMQGQL